MDSWILAHIEEGEAHWWGAGGDWWSRGREDYIGEGDDLQEMCEMSPVIASKMECGEIFRVLFTGVSFVTDEGYWNLDYGYVLPESHIEYDNYRIVSADFEVEG